MPEPKRKEKNPPDQNRRSFLNKLWIGLGIVVLIEFAVMVFAYLKPRKGKAKAGDFGMVIEAGSVEDYTINSVTAFVRGRFYLARLEDGGFLALSRKCTHLGCTIPWISQENQFLCPCHASAFDIRGEVIRSPAPRALDIYPVTIENNIIKVNTANEIKRKRFEPSQVAYIKTMSHQDTKTQRK